MYNGFAFARLDTVSIIEKLKLNGKKNNVI